MRMGWKRFVRVLLAAICCGGAPAGSAGSGDVLEVGKFSAAAEGSGLPAGWEPLAFKNIPRQTRYTAVDEDGTRVVKAVANASASGLVRRIRIDPRQYPIIRWRWKAANLVQRGDVGTRPETITPPAST